jgi:hypothetical protein
VEALLALRARLRPVEADADRLPWAAERPWRVRTHIGVDDGLLVVDLHDLGAAQVERLVGLLDGLTAVPGAAVVFVTGRGRRSRGAPVLPQVTAAALRGLARRHPGWRVVAGGAGRVVLVLDAARAPGHLTGRMGWGLRLLLGALVVAALARCALGCA